MLGIHRSVRPRALLRAAATTAVCAVALAGCGQGEEVAQAEKEGKVVGDAVRAESEESGSDITKTLSENRWQGESDALVTGTYDYLVVNTEEGGCARLVFDSDQPGADYSIEKSYEC